MFKITAVVAGLSLAVLSGCANLTAQQNADIVGCASVLIASQQTTVKGLLAVAQAAPACQALTADALQLAINEAVKRLSIKS